MVQLPSFGCLHLSTQNIPAFSPELNKSSAAMTSTYFTVVSGTYWSTAQSVTNDAMYINFSLYQKIQF
jgi:hypothetical protein